MYLSYFIYFTFCITHHLTACNLNLLIYAQSLLNIQIPIKIKINYFYRLLFLM